MLEGSARCCKPSVMIKALPLPQEVEGGDLGGVFFWSTSCMHSCWPCCCELPGLTRCMLISKLSHRTERLLTTHSALHDAKGTPLAVRMPLDKPKFSQARSSTEKASPNILPNIGSLRLKGNPLQSNLEVIR